MSASTTTPERIRDYLNALSPKLLELDDDSQRHAGHVGAASGGGHYNLRIISTHFAGLSRVARHRLIYITLAPLMQREIHALSIIALTPEEAAAQQQLG